MISCCLPTLLATLLGLPAVCASPVAGAADPAALTPAAGLATALEAVRANDIRADIFFIASDELGGRDTPSEGQRVAARFVRARLERLGFEPGAEHGFFHEYPLELRQIDLAGCSAELSHGGERRELVLGKDYFFSPREVVESTCSGPLVFCGDGSDIEGLDLKGRWGLVQEEGGRTSRRRWRDARSAGALGVIVTPGPAYEGDPYAERYKSYVERAQRPVVRPAGQGEQEAEPEPFSTIYLAPEAARGLVPAGAARGVVLDATFTERRRRKGGEEGRVMAENVCGFWRGSDPALSSEVIILSAHYDHEGIRDGVIYNGADDNGSGTVGLLAVAEALKAYGPMNRSVLLLWVSGEEKGLWGSEAWTQRPWLPEGCRPLCDINIDMIGRNAPDKLLITPTEGHASFNGLARMALQLAPQEGFAPLGSADEYWDRSDHKNFHDHLKIPVAFLFSDIHEDYHQPGDDPEKIDCDKVRRVVRLIVRMLAALQERDLRL